MRCYSGISYQKYRPRVPTKGVFYDNLYRIKEFVTLKGSSYNDNTNTNEYDVLEDQGNYWHSASEENQSFTISLQKHILKLESISMISCKTNNCVKDVDVYGSNENTSWDKICEIRNDDYSFFQKQY